MMTLKHALTLAASVALVGSYPVKLLALDTNSNGLSDAWEERFDASAATLNGDDDADGFTNLEECIAGTDPYDSADRPNLNLQVSQETATQVQLSFDTFTGKYYTIYGSYDLSSFEALIEQWPGNGSTYNVTIQDGEIGQIPSPIQIDFWANVTATTMSDFYALSSYPDSPDAEMSLSETEAPIFLATDYGACLQMEITPPSTGLFNLFLSAGGPAELYFGEESDGSDAVKIAEILPAQTGLTPEEWETFDTQRGGSHQLQDDQSYYFEVRYLGTTPSQHVQIGWSGPGLTGIEKITASSVTVKDFPEAFKPDAPITILERDYDSPSQTDQLWPAFSSIIDGTSLGLEGNVENFNTTTGSAWASTHYDFDTETTDHIYTRFLFHMPSTHQGISFIMKNRDGGNSEEGPHFKIFPEDSGATCKIQAGGTSGNEAQFLFPSDQTYQIEIVASLDVLGFNYNTPRGSRTVPADRFDIYISDSDGNLLGSATDLTFRDPGINTVSDLDDLQAYGTSPNIYFDDWVITNGAIAGDGYLLANSAGLNLGNTPNFFKLLTQEADQDGDGLSDWEEFALATYFKILPFDAEATDGVSDPDVLEAAFSDATGAPYIELFGSDACAMESNYPNIIPDNGEITIQRSGSLEPITVDLQIIPLANSGSTTTICDGTCCLLVGTAGDESAETEDYVITDEEGNVISDTVFFEFGETEKILTVTAVDDSINEYPETLNIGLQASSDGSYEISDLINGASIQLFDLPDSPDNLTLFTGAFSQDGAATAATTATGTVTATLNGPRTEIRLWTTFSGLTSPQTTSHIHKANESGGAFTPGDIIFGINEADGSTPLLGELSEHIWDLSSSSGATSSNPGGGTSRQIIIDSLFGQNDETPLYLNIHTSINTAGEIWAFYGLAEGSIEEPDAPVPADAPGTSGFPQLSGDLLEAEVRRFLNQATFGATEEMVDALIAEINLERSTDPTFHRSEAFGQWMDDQMNKSVTPQTYLLDYLMATHFQLFWLAGVFDPARNPTDGSTATPTTPSQWPYIDRSNSDPAHWYLSQTYPLNFSELQLALANNLGVDRRFVLMPHRSMTHWHTMLNSGDQLRQKMGFALQQIVVASNNEGKISENRYGMLNYQDMLNHYAFEYYRDVLGFVNWSPIMGIWLSSMQNQKALDFDGDGLFDTYPDENLARENMQLFSIGLFELWSDGTLKLTPQGLPRQSYTNDDIKEFAKILTGQSIYYHDTTWGGDEPGTAGFPENNNFGQGLFGGQTASHTFYPMKMFEEYHSEGAKSFAGTTIDNTLMADPEARAIADIEDAIDWLAGKPGDGLPDFDMVNSHISTPAFISLRLIQRFTTSNPSREYLHRVATVFKDSEGHLGQTIKAILLDPEARNVDLSDPVFGMKKSPLEGYLQMLRVLDAGTYIPFQEPTAGEIFDNAPGDFTNPDLYLENFGLPLDQINAYEKNTRFFLDSAYTTTGSAGLQMDPFEQETVFNYYRSLYIPGGAIGAAELYAPEMQIVNEADVMRHINYFQDIIEDGFGPIGDELGNNDANQVAAFGGDSASATNDYIRLDLQALADEFFPATEPSTLGTTTNTRGSTTTQAPHWVRLNRTGNLFTSSESSDGINWNILETWTISMTGDAYIGLALTSHSDGTLTTATFDNISVIGDSGSWTHGDIGEVQAAGSVVDNGGGVIQIQASGADIWNTRDEFHYRFLTLPGDGTITARVVSLVNTNPWAKAGVMIRDSLGDNSRNVMTLISASNGVVSQARSIEGRSRESLADEEMVDELDRRLTNGMFKLRYPYDPSDDGLDLSNKNPREWIIDTITLSYGDSYDGSNDASNRYDKFSDALYLLTASPEFQVRK